MIESGDCVSPFLFISFGLEPSNWLILLRLGNDFQMGGGMMHPDATHQIVHKAKNYYIFGWDVEARKVLCSRRDLSSQLH